MIIKKLPVGPIAANCFIVGCKKTKEAVVIDPGDEVDKILITLANSNLKVKYILNTHGHFDHVGGNKQLKKATGAELIIHSLDAPMLSMVSNGAMIFGLRCDDSPPPDRLIADGDIINFGEISLKVIHTPGHTPGGVCFYTNGSVFVGDTLFAGSIGRTDFPGGDYEALIKSIHTKLFPLSDNVTVYTGHGPETTIQNEKLYNFFVGGGKV
ncbi:MAG: MBL fold metallo-hydrolase [Desulfobacterales bacterium]|nr:MBL fold metallo-hydrolase [Desulfobacterales bacterium]